MDDVAAANALGEYLRARRGLVAPEQVGLPGGPHRRVAGLRREEVALLAGISADYYLRLERGRDSNPSVQVLESLARVLQLDDVETAYLMGLTAPRPRTRRSRHAERVPPRLLHLLAALDVPAFVEGRYFDVLASNPAAVALSPRLVPGQNRLRSLLLDPEERRFHTDWEDAVVSFVAAARRVLSEGADDPRAAELVGELSIASVRFRTLWARHDVRALEGGTASVDHPVVGALTLHREKLPVEDVILVIYYPAEHSADAEKLRLLGGAAIPTQGSPRGESAP
ncbi:helix-turn-helix transcriptional regulator [Herbiconiux sp. CPCC 203407]|uniref:Helix-turn-helix transcriptional regulator n=1 Tax=Herbiconiux oxytropis TaxID=2970915 RepID=A0AA41XJG1_9MICO|nr:helix-turn-helix transcriptional regulator [Herbiconiux oxytropis]MCS5723390.1 helix-turn-helix transcriptional regulator [Herbiconiux oxytropis]MCS5727963.1 helix-turn-helix transcriptional regulator [Herbiconiux oxytropis]